MSKTKIVSVITFDNVKEFEEWQRESIRDIKNVVTVPKAATASSSDTSAVFEFEFQIIVTYLLDEEAPRVKRVSELLRGHVDNMKEVDELKELLSVTREVGVTDFRKYIYDVFDNVIEHDSILAINHRDFKGKRMIAISEKRLKRLMGDAGE